MSEDEVLKVLLPSSRKAGVNGSHQKSRGSAWGTSLMKRVFMARMDKHQAAFVSLLALSGLIARRPIRETFAMSFQSDVYSHIILVVPISVLLFYLQRESRKPGKTWAFFKGCAFFAAAIAMVWSAHRAAIGISDDVVLAIEMTALVLSWNGAFVLCFGAKMFRTVLFPLLFMFWLVPLPKAILDVCIILLQRGSAWSTHLLLAVAGVPVIQHGVILTIPSLTVEVAEECSSIRSSSVLLISTMAMAYLLLRSPWRRTLAIAFSFPLCVVKNGLRIFAIVMLGTKVDPGYLTGTLHRQGGVLFFIVAFLAELAILLLLRRGEEQPSVRRLDGLRALTLTDESQI